MKKLLLLFIGLLFWAGSSWGQVSTYTFASSAGTYTAISGGSVLISGTSAMDTWVSNALTIPSFNFNGVSYTTAYVTSNGLLTLGGPAPSFSCYAGISENTGSGIAICPFSSNLDRVNNTALSEIRWENTGNEIIFQWQQVKRFGATIAESFDMQVRLNTTNGVVKFVYNLNSEPGSSRKLFPQVGIRTSTTDYNNRWVATGSENWATSLQGTDNTNTCRFNGIPPAKNFSSGLTYTFTPPVINTPPNCAINPSPVNSAAGVLLSSTLSWSAGGGIPTGYKLYFGTDGSGINTPINIVNGSTQTSPYTIGSALSYSTTYYWQVVPFNSFGSAAVCPIWSFTTMADPTISTFPYVQSFDDATFPPNGWTNINTAGPGIPGIWDRQTTGTSPACTPRSGAAMIRYNSNNLAAGTKGELISPPFNFPDNDYRVSFWMYRDVTYPMSLDRVNVHYNTTNSSTGGWLLGTINRTTFLEPVEASSGWHQYFFNVPRGSSINEGYFIFEAVSDNAYNMFIDDVTIEKIPSNPIFSINPTYKDFGAIISNENPTSAQVFVIANKGMEPLVIQPGAISITGVDADQFTLSEASGPIVLNSRESTAIKVAFAPTTVGNKTAVLNLVHNASASPSTVTLTGIALPTGSLCEGFEGETFPPTGWTVINGDGGNTWVRDLVFPRSGNASAYIYYNSTAHNDWLITPMLEPQLENSTLYFWARNRSNSYLERFNLKLSTTGTNESNFTVTLASNFEPGTIYTKYSCDLSSYIGQNVYVAVQAISADQFALCLDDFGGLKVHVPSCPAPTALSLSNLTATSATLGWTQTGAASSWNIKWGVSGFNPANGGTLISPVGANPYTLSDLTGNTTYDWYVQADCGAEQSNWAGPKTFTTPCGPASIPYYENFNAATLPALPSCMSMIDANTDGITWRTAAIGIGLTNAAVINYNTEMAMNDWLFTAGLQLEANKIYELEFFYAGYKDYVEKLAVYWGSAPQVASMTVGPIIDLSFGDTRWQKATAIIKPTSAGVYYIGFNGYSNKDQVAILIDNISIYVPTCPTPSALTVSDLTTSSAHLGWTENGSATSWNIKWGVSGFNPATQGTLISPVGAKPYTLSGLNANTAYDWYVQAACGSEQSNWAGPETFTTRCGPVSIPYFENFDAVTAPALPNCMSMIDANTDNTTWKTATVGMSRPNAAIITYNDNIPMNDWLFTAGLQLEANKTYELGFFYAANSRFVEKLAVYWGGAPQVESMTGGPIFDQSFGDGSWHTATATITPTSPGIYYIGFKGYSDADEYVIYLDDLYVIEKVPNAEWSGTIDNNWQNAGNWVDGALPGSSTDVVIPAGLTNYPTITNGANCNTITLKSDASGTASILGNTKLVVNGNATVERYISGAPEAWHLLSSPVEAQSISGNFIPEGTYGDETGYDFYAWNEPSETWLNQKVTTNALNEFTPGQGYLVAYQAANPTKTFTGKLNKWYCYIPLTVSGTSSYKGSNLLGNPYPSSIDWKSSSPTGLDKSKLVVEPGGGHNMYIYNQVNNNYGVYNDANSGDGGTNGTTRYIAPMQGFFVIAAEVGYFYFNEPARVHSTQSWLKSGNDNAFRLSVTAPANEGKDEILLDFGHEASQGGADKWYSMSTTAPSMFVPTAERDYSIRFLTSIADNPIVPVAFKAGVDGEYSIQANFSQSAFSVKLMDQLTGNVQDLNKNPFYTFTATTGDVANRFNLVFGTLGIDNPESAEAIQVYAYGDVLYFATSSKEAALVNVYNLTGQLVMQAKTNGSDLTTFNASALSNGVYVVTVISNQGVVSQKVVIRK